MDEIQRFRLFLATEKGQREKTLHTNIKIIRKILATTSLTKEGVDSFVLSLIERRLAPNYIRQQVGVIRQWGECFGIQDLATYPYPKIKYYLPPFIKATMSDEEIDDFLNLPFPGKEEFYKKRYDMWTLFFSIQAWTGMRCGEIAKLQIDDIDFGRNVIILAETKTNVPRLVPIPPDIKELLKDYIANHQEVYLFPPYQASKLPYISETAWENHFRERIARLGIKRKNLTAYSFRHSYITRQLDEGVALKKVQLIVGHRRIETTAVYAQFSMKSLQKVIDNDRLRSLYQTGKEALQSLHKEMRRLEDKYQEKILTNIHMGDSEDEMVIVFKIKK